MKLIEKLRDKFKKLIIENELSQDELTIKARGLSSEEAIGNPERDDFPLLEGKEVMIQAEYKGAYGQAFTDHPGNFRGNLAEILELDLTNNYYRALFIAALNAVLNELGIAEKTVHCRDEEPENCAQEVVDYLKKEHSFDRIGIIGYQPAIVAKISSNFKQSKIMVTDLNSKKIGKIKSGIKLLDAANNTETLIKESDLVLATGSSMVNGTIDEIKKLVEKYDKDYYFFGNTIAGSAVLLDLPRLCFYGHK